jgi:TIR domain
VSTSIFVSYSSKDQQIAETIYKALEIRGLDCWIASRDVRPGENYQEAIVKALRSAKIMLLVFTSNANNSDEIKKELVLAGRHRVTVVPARVEDVVPNDAFTYELATRQWIDLFKDWERQIEILAVQLGQILQSASSEEGDGAVVGARAPSLRPATTKLPLKQKLIFGSVLTVMLILVGCVALYMRPFFWTTQVARPTIPQIAQQVRPVAPISPVETTVQASSQAPPPAPVLSPDETVWANATGAGTRGAFDEYLKAFPAGVHAQEAQLRIASLILNGSETARNFDGTWITEWTCPNLGQYPGYTYRFSSLIKDGAYHGTKGVKGEPGSMVLNGKIDSDGAAAFFGEIIVGSSLVGLGAARGTPSDFHALAHFDHASGIGKRIEGRPCNLTFGAQ